MIILQNTILSDLFESCEFQYVLLMNIKQTNFNIILRSTDNGGTH